MGRKEILNKRLTRYLAKKDDLAKRALESNDANEVRAINAQLADLNEDIEDVRAEIALIEEQEERSKPAKNAAVPENGDYMPEKGQQRAKMPFEGDPIGKTMGTSSMNGEKRDNTDPFGTMEYRTAFMAYVQKGTPISAELRAGGDLGATVSEELGAIIPTTIMNEFIKDVQKVYGQVYSKVRKLSIKGGVKFPISDLKAKFKWISESTGSPRQKAGDVKDYIEFSYNIGEIRVAQSLLSSIITLGNFESEIVRIMVEAYVEAMDKGILTGTGEGQMLGILNDPRVTNVVEFTDAEFSDWTKWRKKLFNEVPLANRGKGEFLFTASTLESYLLTMQDGNGRPLFREATELTLDDTVTNGRFFGRPVTLVEPDCGITDMGISQAGDVIGVFWIPDAYAINTNMQFGIKRWFDDDTNQWVNKGLTVVDGKILDTSCCYILKKKA